MTTPTRDELLPMIQQVWPSDRIKWSVDGDLPKLEQFAALLYAHQAQAEPITWLKENDSGGYDQADKDEKFAFPVYSAPPSQAQEPSKLEANTDLHRFYGTDTDASLIAAQARHIEKLQAKLQPSPSFAPQRVREG